MMRVHGTCVAIGGAGVLLRGASGAGKSDLALRLIDLGAELVADDQVEIVLGKEGLVASPPATIAGMMEVRGLGVIAMPYRTAPLVLVIDLTPGQPVERMPEPSWVEILGERLPLRCLDPREASAGAKVRLAVGIAKDTILSLR